MIEIMSNEAIDACYEEVTKRLDFAYSRAELLQSEIKIWHDSNPLESELLIDEDSHGWQVITTQVDPAPDFSSWGIALGEIVHHLRSTLNTMLTRLARVEEIPPTKRLQFPIALSRKQWYKNNGELSRLKGFPDTVIRAIYALQPFLHEKHENKTATSMRIAVLAWMDNQDKHFLELEGIPVPSFFDFQFSPKFKESVVDETCVKYTHDFSLQEGSALIRADCSPYTVLSIEESEYDLSIEVGFRDEEGYITPLGELLDEIFSAVSHAVQIVFVAWSDPEFDVELLAGSSDFHPGASFGMAAVDSGIGAGTWEKDYRYRKIPTPGDTYLPPLRNTFDCEQDDHDRTIPLSQNG